MACQIPPISTSSVIAIARNSGFLIIQSCLLLFFLPSQDAFGQKSAKDNQAAKPKQTSSANRSQEEFFESKIRPVLVKHCYECHSRKSNKNNGGLFLDTAQDLIKGGDMGSAIQPGNAKASLLLQALKYEDLEMPPDEKLDDRIIKDFEQWINSGAFDPRESTIHHEEASRKVDWDAAREFWSLQPLVNQAIPKTKDSQWPSNRIDYFVLAQLESNELGPSPPASQRALKRRLAYDLTGLPPKDFEGIDINTYLDSLLGSSAFGEKWARLWLDIARYAEDQAHIVGNNQSLFYPNAYRYRDWVINAMNQDLPYDEFVTRQLAVDLLAKEKNDKLSDDELAALGFIGLGPKYYRRNTPLVMADEWEDRIDTVSRGLLGLTVACARCHDHKYDPISTEDYYALAGVFASTEMYNKPATLKQQDASKTKTDQNKKKKKKAPTQTIHVVREKSPKDINVQIRGDANSKGKKVKRRFLTILNPQNRSFNSKNSGRLDLAREIANASNPLFARVIVNRVWTDLVGQPLVGTPSNFGALGERPTHPRLLDDLSFRLIENGWSLKWLVREIVTSQTYQQTSFADSDKLAKDPANKMLSRMNRKSLSVEQWRDAILASSNVLDRQVGGRSITPSNPGEIRRTIYSKVSRFQLDPMLALFDFPDPNAHSAKRSRTISPLQKMFALNNQFLLQQSEKLEADLQNETQSSQNNDFVKAAFRRLFQRDPSPEEQSLAERFLEASPEKAAEPGKPDPTAVESRRTFLQTLLISNEFIFVD